MLNKLSKEPHILFLVERGWRGPRELALTLARQHVVSQIIIKGKVPDDVLEIITPRAGIAVISIHRWYFKLAIMWYIIRLKLFGRLKCVVVNKERTLRWVRLFARIMGCETVLLNERNEEIELSDYQQKTLRIEDLARFLINENRTLL